MRYCGGEGTISRGIGDEGPWRIETFPWDEDHEEPDRGISKEFVAERITEVELRQFCSTLLH